MSDRPVDQLRIAFFGSSLASSSLADLAAQRDAIEASTWTRTSTTSAS